MQTMHRGTEKVATVTPERCLLKDKKKSLKQKNVLVVVNAQLQSKN